MVRLRIGDKAPDFNLPGVEGKVYSFVVFQDKPVLVVMFTCNHCPYVRAYEDRLIAIQRDYADRGVSLVAINANDARNYPADSFPNMVKRAEAKGYNFPYLRDEDQAVAAAYGATYTPEIFVLDRERRLRYAGRIDDNWQQPQKATSHDLRNALEALLNKQPVPKAETHAIGCTVKWAN
jgi:peroxiredoxin